MSYYHAEIINLSLKNTYIIKKFHVLQVKKRFLGVVKIYTISIPENDVEEAINLLQTNIGGKLKKEWYITIHNNKRVIIIFKNRIFELSGEGITPVYQKMLDTSHAEEKSKWDDMIDYAKALGIPDTQCDFLPEDFAMQDYRKW